MTVNRPHVQELQSAVDNRKQPVIQLRIRLVIPQRSGGEDKLFTELLGVLDERRLSSSKEEMLHGELGDRC